MEEQKIQGFLGQIPEAIIEPTKYCLYARKSTEQDERQALSIDSQLKEMLELANKDGLNVVDIRKESHSAKASSQRPVFNSLLDDIRSGKFNGLLTWAPDRLSRNAGDLGSLVDLMDQKLLHEIRTNGQRFTNNPNEKFLLMILCSQAKLENDNKSINVKRGLKAKIEMGLRPGMAPTGYLNEHRTDRKGYVQVDTQRAPIIIKMFEKVAYEGWTGRQIYHWLKHELRFTTKNNKPLALSNVYSILKNSFYYGEVEYPKGSGKWHKGQHKSLISKELFQKVNGQLSRDQIVRKVTKEFAFTKLMVCGLCGSGISAEEKYKPLKDGTVNRYIYYGCSRGRDLYCKSGYVREEELINQLTQIIDQIDINELGMRARLEEEVKRYKFFQNKVLGEKQNDDNVADNVNIRNYAKYILKQGSISEKRELLGCLKSKIKVANKQVSLGVIVS